MVEGCNTHVGEQNYEVGNPKQPVPGPAMRETVGEPKPKIGKLDDDVPYSRHTQI